MDRETAKSVAAQLRKPSGEWAERIAEFMAKGNALLIQRSIEAFSPAAGDRILEIGMGSGVHVCDICASSKTIDYTGYDYSEEMVRIASDMNDLLVSDK